MNAPDKQAAVAHYQALASEAVTDRLFQTLTDINSAFAGGVPRPVEKPANPVDPEITVMVQGSYWQVRYHDFGDFNHFDRWVPDYGVTEFCHDGTWLDAVDVLTQWWIDKINAQVARDLEARAREPL